MKIILTIEGAINSEQEPLDAELITPDDWKPSFNEFCKVKFVVRWLNETLSQEFSPGPKSN